MSAAQLLDMSAIDEARSMFRAKFPTMSGYYFEDAEGYVASIRSAIAGGDIPAIVAPAHTLKSSSRQMGAAEVSVIAKSIEEAARDQLEGVNWFSERLRQLEEAFSMTRTAYPQE
jgi:HPt (histidine-containing phosphotransfer) domain-containing protein